MNRKQILRAHLHAPVTGRALRVLHHRQTVRVHRNRAEIAGGHAVAEAQATPRAAFAAAAHQGRRAAAFHALVEGAHLRHVPSARTGQARHAMLRLTGVDAE